MRMNAIEVLESSSLFAGLDQSALKELAGAFTSETWPKNVEIAAATATGMYFRVIASGRVKIVRSNSHNGRELTLWLLGPGDAFDILVLLDDRAHPNCARTLDEVETLSIPITVLREWLERSAPLQVAAHRYVARQLAALTDLATDLALTDTMTRLAHLLLRHFDPDQRTASQSRNLIRDLSQEELASLVGSVRVVVSRSLAALKRQGVIDTHHGALRVLDLKRLLHLAEAHIARAERSRVRDRSRRDITGQPV